MKKLLLMLALALPFALTSCENPFEDDKKDSDYQSEKDIIVEMRSSAVVNGRDGDVYQYDGDGWRVIVTENTKVYVQRESCSGLDQAHPSEVKAGYTIIFKYNAEEVDYAGSPNTVRASVIEAYRPECLEPVPDIVL